MATRQVRTWTHFPRLFLIQETLTKKGPMTQQPTPALKFRGTHNHAEVHTLLHRGVISPFQFCLIAVVDSLVDEEEGCWASNSYLAKLTNVGERHVRRALNSLEEIGLIRKVGSKVIGSNTFRTIETKWSRVHDGRPPGPAGPPSPGPAGPPESFFQKDITDNSSMPAGMEEGVGEERLLRGKSQTGEEARARQTRTGGKPMPFIPAPEPDGPATEEDRRLAEELRRALSVKGMISGKHSMKTWAKQISKVRRVKGKTPGEISATLEWLCGVLGKKYVPVVLSASAFYRKYDQIVAAKARAADVWAAQEENVRVTHKTRERVAALPFIAFSSPPPVTKLERVYQRVSDCYAAFAKAVRASGHPLAGHLDDALPAVPTFVENWLKANSWASRLWELADKFDQHDKYLTEWGRAEARDYCGSAGAWDKLVKEVFGG